MSDLTAARLLRRCARLLHERTPQHATRDFDACPECSEWRVFPDDDDEGRAEAYAESLLVAWADRDAARALADELAEAGRGHSWRDMWHTGVVRPDECKVCAALAKWEASK